MKHSGWTRGAALVLAMLWACPSAALAQDDPHVGYVHPAGLQRGTSVEVTVGGQFLEGVSGVVVSGAGVQALVVDHDKPLTRRQLKMLRERMKEMRQQDRPAREEGAPSDDAREPPLDPAWMEEMGLGSMGRAELAQLRRKLNDPKRQPNPQIAEQVVLTISALPDAEPGTRQLRLVTPNGLSNPLRFQVGAWPELQELEPNDEDGNALLEQALPAVLNGQILPGDVDRFRFRARQGTRLVVAASARELIPYLADAVPGWFQATLALFDAQGNELAFVDDYRFHPDPVLRFDIPADGTYELEIRDSIYRGREDFVYRITLGELPFVTSAFPLGGRAGASTSVALQGWNLPCQELVVDGRGAAPGVLILAEGAGQRFFNSIPFVLDSLPECLEAEDNDAAAQAQHLELPVVVNGRIDRPGDRDVFRVEGRAGDVLVAEVRARRSGSSLDSVLRCLDAQGRELARNDDHQDRGAGLVTHHADSRLSLTLPADGSYTLHLTDAQGQGGPDCAYRLRVGPPQPDFELRVVPPSLNLRAGTAVPLTVHALRRDGFEGEIALELANAPPGFTLSGASVPPHETQVRLTLSAPRAPLAQPASLRIEGRARIAGREVRRPARPAEDRMQAFLNRHLVPADDLMVAVTGKRRPPFALQIVGEIPVRLPAGGTAQVRLRWTGRRRPGPVVLELNQPPAGVTLQDVTIGQREAVLLLQAAEDEAIVGQRGNLIVDVYREQAPNRRGRPANRTRRRHLGSLPAIPFQIVGP